MCVYNIQLEKKQPEMIYLISIMYLLQFTQQYIDFELTVSKSSEDISFNIPMKVGKDKYQIGVSLQNRPQFISSPHPNKHTNKKNNKFQGQIHVSSLQGYTLQGWRRFYIQVFTFQDSKYSHTFNIDLSPLKEQNKKNMLNNGIMSLGPNFSDNYFYKMIKSKTNQYFTQDIVSFFTTPNGKQVKMQLGGYQQQNARGYNNGVRFYQKSIIKSTDNSCWKLPVIKVGVTKETQNKWKTFNIPFSSMNLKLTIQSQMLILPQRLKQDLQTSLQSQTIECSFSISKQLQCKNISSIDQALTFISFYLDQYVMMNVSLYDLRDQYNPKSKVTSFFIKLGQENQVQIGSPLLHGYYVSLNLTKPSILFSPINRMAPQLTSVSIMRFLLMFAVFMIAACICIFIWQHFSTKSNQKYQKKFTRGKQGVRLVAYQRPPEFDEDD